MSKLRRLSLGTVKEKIKQQQRDARIAQRKAEELRFNNMIKAAVKSVFPNNHRVSVSVGTDMGDRFESIERTVQGYKGDLELTNSEWAPWSKSFRNNKILNIFSKK